MKKHNLHNLIQKFLDSLENYTEQIGNKVWGTSNENQNKTKDKKFR